MKKAILFALVILVTLSTGKAQKSWAYENQKHKKGGMTGSFFYKSGNSWIEENNIEGPHSFEEYKITELDLILFDKKRNVYVKLTQKERFYSFDYTWFNI